MILWFDEGLVDELSRYVESELQVERAHGYKYNLTWGGRGCGYNNKQSLLVLAEEVIFVGVLLEVLSQFFALLLQVGRQLVVDIVKERQD